MSSKQKIERKRVGIYARCSTAEQNPKMQVDELKAIAKQRGWSVAGLYVDEGQSGTAVDRPALGKMLEDARMGRIDVVGVWKLDRLGRSLQHLLQVLDELANLNVAFFSARDVGMDSTTPQGKLWIAIVGAFAGYEAAMIKERVIAGVRRAQAEGKHCGRPFRDIDIRPALALIREGRGLKSISKMLGLSRATLRRRLKERGEWPIVSTSRSTGSR